jgi:hypothetical protein
MLVSYDLFRKHLVEDRSTAGDSVGQRNPSLRSILPYAPYIMLLLGYLEWRRIVFSHFLAENYWTDSWGTQMGAPGLTDLLQQLAHLGRYLGSHLAFNLRHLLLLPFRPFALGLVLGLYLFWAFFLLQRRSDGRNAIAVVLYFGLVWYLISDIPLLVASFEARHLYLPAVGPCIATAFLAMPPNLELRERAGYPRLLEAALLAGLFACQLRQENSQYLRRGEVSASGIAQMAAMLGAMPKQTLVIIQFPEEAFLPFALQRPFTSTDLYSRVRVIEFPQMCGWPLPQWWENTRQMLGAELAGTPDEQIEIQSLAWDERNNTLQGGKRFLPRRLLQACVTESLGRPLENVNSLGDEKARKLVEALARLVSEGTSPP